MGGLYIPVSLPLLFPCLWHVHIIYSFLNHVFSRPVTTSACPVPGTVLDAGPAAPTGTGEVPVLPGLTVQTGAVPQDGEHSGRANAP